jgi:hypothetical protein
VYQKCSCCREGRRIDQSCDVVSVEASAKPTWNSKANLQISPKIGEEGSIKEKGQSVLEGSCLGNREGS